MYPIGFLLSIVAYDRAIDNAELEARSLAAEVAPLNSPAAVEHIALIADGAADMTPATVFLRNGNVLGLIPGTPGAPPSIVRAGFTTVTGMIGGDRGVWEPVGRPSAAVAVLARVPSALLSKGVALEWTLLFGGGFLLVLIAIALADWMGGTIVRPMSDLELVTRRMSEGDLEGRVIPRGPYEVAEVGRAVNELADQINGLLASARVAGADLGHRLRTPLTAMRLDIESLNDANERAVLAMDFDSLEAAVSRLIRETRTSPTAPRRADLAGAVRDRMSFWSVLAKSQNRPFLLEAPSRRIEIGLDKGEVEAAIDALVSNIFAHTPEGTGFRVVMRNCRQRPGFWAVLVEDDGPAASQMESFRPPQNAGTGLGLDIVRRTVERVGGTTHIGHSQSGGYRVELTLPGIDEYWNRHMNARHGMSRRNPRAAYRGRF